MIGDDDDNDDGEEEGECEGDGFDDEMGRKTPRSAYSQENRLSCEHYVHGR